MADEVPVQHVVVDTGAFIRNASLRDIGANVYTVQGVLGEISDKATRRHLANQLTLKDLNVLQPDQEAMTVVSSFARKTGDYRHLSATDLRVLALTYMLEKQHVGTDHIRTQPLNLQAEYVVPSKGSGDMAKIAGFYVDKSQDNTQRTEETKDDDKPSPAEDVDRTSNAQECGEHPTPDHHDGGDPEMSTPAGEHGNDAQTELSSQQHTENNHQLPDSENVSPANVDSDVLPDNLLETDEESEEEEEEDGWITPSNIESVKRQMGLVSVETQQAQVTVACLTTDFAMQNVLIQMGLHVVSVDGMLIKRAKSYVLRCFACFKITYNLEKEFCPSCGNKTLKRVSVSRDQDGKIHYYFSKRPLNTRGMKFPLPKPSGGKHSNNPRVCEDQPMPHQRMPRKTQQKMDIFSPDYVAGSSPFSVNDVTSRAAQVGLSGKHDFRHAAYWNKRNPNEARKKYGRKK